MEGRSKTLSRWHLLYIENLKESTKWLWQLINKFEGYEIDTQESIIILYHSNKPSKNKIDVFTFTIASRKNRILRNKLN